MRWLLLLFCCLAFPALAQENITPQRLDAFARLPVLHEGRIKPIDSFARLHYQAVTGQSAARDNSAVAWLAETLFNPAEAARRPDFRVQNNDVIRRLGLPAREDPHYSFDELVKAMLAQQKLIAPLLAAESKNLTADERALRALYRTVNDSREISGAFSLLLPITMPLDSEARQQLNVPDDAVVTLRQLRKLKPAVMEQLQATMAQKQDRVADYTEAEQHIAHLAYQINLLESVGANNALLRVIPPLWEGQEEWRAPWDIVQQSLDGPAAQQFFDHWGALAQAWQNDDGAWDYHCAALQQLDRQARPAGFRAWALDLEILLNRFAPFTISLWLIGFGLVLLGFGQWRAPWLSGTLARGALTAALLVHGLGLLARMAILLRPPVSTLYESTLFVSLLALATGLWLARRRHSDDGLWIGGGIAALLLLCSRVFGADGDTLLVLTAVLDTRFWLATHVVCITAGYAATLVAGMMAHLYLLRRIAKPQEVFSAQINRLHSIALVALLLTAVGTMLGGVWADQSWGRFWGWDPKENGALWIVLWLIWLVHGRIAGQFTPLGFAAGMALVNIVVALAWFGVNLLSVGLHSYGFTDAAAYGLLAFCVGEFLIVSGLTVGILVRRRQHAAA